MGCCTDYVREKLYNGINHLKHYTAELVIKRFYKVISDLLVAKEGTTNNNGARKRGNFALGWFYLTFVHLGKDFFADARDIKATKKHSKKQKSKGEKF